MNVLTADKRELRRHFRQLRREFLATPAGQIAVRRIVKAALTSAEFHRAQKILAYNAQTEELPLADFLRQAETMGKELYLPGRGGTKGEMVAVHLASTPPSGVWYEPYQREILPPEALDLIIVPGVAFTKDGVRLGMGGGYYDRYLPRAVRAYRLALALDIQVAPQLPAEPHDAKIHGLITESLYNPGIRRGEAPLAGCGAEPHDILGKE